MHEQLPKLLDDPVLQLYKEQLTTFKRHCPHDKDLPLA